VPIVLGASRPRDRGQAEPRRITTSHCVSDAADHVRPIEIGLVNNMPDAALEATERQFVEVLGAATGQQIVHLHLFSLPQVPRGEAARAYLGPAYTPLDELDHVKLDALIVTGTEPRALSLEHEPYWEALAGLIDWAEHNTISTIWSCLAAHAAVLHLDGVSRHRLDEKCFGVFAGEQACDDKLLAGAPSPLYVTHARCNGLREAELVAHGYRILTRSAAGVDMFAKPWRSLFLFFQGHPEYGLDSLAREYRRDMGRFLRGESGSCPPLPQGYFDERSEKALAAFTARAREQPDADLTRSFPDDLRIRPHLAGSWHAPAISVLRNWLAYIVERKDVSGARLLGT